MKRVGATAATLSALLGCHKTVPTEASDDDRAAAPIAVSCVSTRPATGGDHILLRGVVGVPPDHAASVAAAVAGRIIDVRVHEGDVVKRGDLLATIDDTTLDAAVKQADAMRTAAQATLSNADAALTRAKRLFERGIAPRRDVEDAEARRATAQAEVATTNAQRDLAARERNRARVIAPIAGVVVHVSRQAGELVDGTSAAPLFELADPTNLVMRADVPAAALLRIALHATVQIHLDAAPTHVITGEVNYVSPSVDTATALGTLRASLVPVAGLSLKLGLAGSIDIALGASTTDAVVVPAAAVRRSLAGGEEVVVCATQNGAIHAAVRPIVVGNRYNDEVTITQGVKANEAVVVSHVIGLEDGALLQTAAPTATPP